MSSTAMNSSAVSYARILLQAAIRHFPDRTFTVEALLDTGDIAVTSLVAHRSWSGRKIWVGRVLTHTVGVPVDGVLLVALPSTGRRFYKVRMLGPDDPPMPDAATMQSWRDDKHAWRDAVERRLAALEAEVARLKQPPAT